MLFKTIDESLASCIHDCSNYKIAIQAHLLHFGLISVKIENVEHLEGNIEPCFEYIEQLEHEGIN
jgi:hypothetical protein